jgi:Tfp pilus assembly protein PilN
MRQINLLPPEIAQRRRVREVTLLIGAAGLGLLALLVVVFLFQTARLSGAKNDLAGAQNQNASLQRQINSLQTFATLEQTLKTKQQLLTQLTVNEVRWSVLLNDISLVIPSDVWLTTFSGAVAGGAGAPVTGTAPIGSITMSGNTFTHLDVAKWLSRLAIVKEFAFPYLTLSAKSEQTVTFNSTVDIAPAALRRNQPGGERTP